MSNSSTASKKQTKQSLRSLIDHSPMRYFSKLEQRRRLAVVIQNYADYVPRLHLAIMFARTEQTITVRIAQAHPTRDGDVGRRLFAHWLKNEPLFEVMPLLSEAEMVYLRTLRSKVNRTYYAQRNTDPNDYAAALQAELEKAAGKDSSKKRCRCTSDGCSNRFPRKAKYFPNLGRGGKSAGRCTKCEYLAKAIYSRRYRNQGPSGEPGKQLSDDEKQRFWEIESELREKLPTRVLAALFGVSSSTINQFRRQPFERMAGKAVFHRLQKRTTAPRFPFLTKDENRTVADEWRKIRSESTEKEFASADERRVELLQYTATLLENYPTLPTRPCLECQNTYLLDEMCFPYGRDKSTREKVLRKHCRACYAELWD